MKRQMSESEPIEPMTILVVSVLAAAGVLACATYDGFLFPPMENLLAHLKTKAFQSRTIALMENGTWAPMAAKLMRAELEGMKNITVCDTVVTLRSASNTAAEAQMDALVDELLAK